MTTATAQMITVDRDELRDIAIDVQAMWDYVTDLLGADNGSGGPINRLANISHRLEALLGVSLPEDGSAPSPAMEEEDDAMFSESIDRARLWRTEDEEVICQLIGERIANCLRFFA